MNNKNLNAVQVWKDFEDLLAPQLSFSPADRIVYSHLFRHSRLEGKLQFQFSIPWLARGVSLSFKTVRDAVRRLVARGVLHLVERNCQAHHVVRLRLPLEVKGIRDGKTLARPSSAPRDVVKIEEMDFLQTRPLRQSIHAREDGHCFYCLRGITHHRRCIDHVVPLAQLGRNSYSNLVSCCVDCNSKKGERSAEEFFRWLYREHRLNTDELTGRLRALQDLQAGKLIPPLPGQEDRKIESRK